MRERLGTPLGPVRNAGDESLGSLLERFALGGGRRLRHRARVGVNPARGLEEILERALLVLGFLCRYRCLHPFERALEPSLERALFRPRQLAHGLERRTPLGDFGGTVQQIGSRLPRELSPTSS